MRACGETLLGTGRLAMAAAIKVRQKWTAEELRKMARGCAGGDQVRRLLAIRLILDGDFRSEAAKLAAVTLQIVRERVLRFNVEGPGGLVNRKASGRASILDGQRGRLAAYTKVH